MTAIGRLACLTLAALAGAALLLGPGPAAAQGGGEAFRVVVNAANPIPRLAKREVARLFLKQSLKWPDAAAAIPVDQSTVSSVRAAFSRAVFGQSVDAVQQYWRIQISEGSAAPPPVKTSDADVIAFVRANPGAIGYVSASANMSAGVRDLRIDWAAAP